MDDLSGLLDKMGLPAGLAALLVAGLLIAERLKLFERPNKSEREILSADQETFRRAILDRLKASEERADAGERDRETLRDQLVECEKRHAELGERFDAQVQAVRQELAACEERHNTFMGYFTKFIEAVKACGIDLLLDTSGVAPMPANAEALLDATEPAPQGKDRRVISIPVTVDRRKARPAKDKPNAP